MLSELIALIDVLGQVVTADAMGCQKEVAEAVIAGKGEFVLALKENQPAAHEEAGLLFETPELLWRL